MSSANRSTLPGITLYNTSKTDEGHRAPYILFLSKLFELRTTNSIFEALSSNYPVLIPMIEDSPARYFFVAISRALFGKRTAGFLFRPGPTIEHRSIRLLAKYYILRMMRRLSRVSTITIVPFSVEPRFATIATAWVNDPQLWDLDDSQISSRDQNSSDIGMSVSRTAAGRHVCVAIGRQDADKGFDLFTEIYTQNSELRQTTLFAFGGRVSSKLAAHLANFIAAGGHGYNRFITDTELLDLYSSADLVWCAYSSDYDQASGVFGRAIQLGIPVVVRRNSLIHRQCDLEKIRHIAIDNSSDWHMLSSPPKREPIRFALERAIRTRSENIARLNNALGIEISSVIDPH